MIPVRVSAAAIALLLLLRAVMAALLPLSGDEAYYWLWSQHLSLGYYDHPPAIAWLIRFGTLLLGDTELGVRLSGVLLSLPATWFVWRAAALLFEGASSPAPDAKGGENIKNRAALAALLFNLTLMASVELLAATPDMPSLVAAAAFVFALAKVRASGDGRWWLMVGVAGGLGLLSKYSGLFLGASALAWLVVDRDARKWLLTPWPYLGAGVALLVWTPHLWWQSQHGWMTFAFQFGRVSGGSLTWRFLAEFVAAQAAMATPLILVLMLVGLWRASRLSSPLLMPAALVWVGIAYFLGHALHDRVQGNWPCFLYPALAILAAQAFAVAGRMRWLSLAAAPLAAILLLLAYAQAQFGIIPLARDPAARLLGRDFRPAADVAAALAGTGLAKAILTTDYETTAWLRFYYPKVPVAQVNQPQRYLWAPSLPPDRSAGLMIYLVEARRDRRADVQAHFRRVGFPTQLQTHSSLYLAYPVEQPLQSAIGRMP
jgi:4-amino-4-deoxy-L-arabinose transferase-like glycosyltransferase